MQNASSRFPIQPARIFLGFVLALLPVAPGSAQSVVAPLPSYQTGQSPSTASDSSDGSSASVSSANSTALIEWGPINGHVRLDYRFASIHGIQLQPGQTANTTLQNFSPGVFFELGRHWSLSYSPTWNFYSNSEFHDGVDHSVRLNGQTDYEDWHLGFSQTYDRTDQALVQTGRQTQTELYSTSGTVYYRISSRYSVETDLNQQLRYAADYNDVRDLSLLEWLHVQFSPEWDTAVGAGPGYTEINRAPDLNTYQFLTKTDYRLGRKLSLHAEAGLDRRKSRANFSRYENNVIAKGSLDYQLAPTTELQIGIDRSVSAAYQTRLMSKTTELSAELGQQLHKILRLDLSGGLSNTKYLSDGYSPSDNGRSDNSSFVQVRLEAALLQRTTASVFFRHLRNSSNEDIYSITSNQGGVELRYQY